ncbi:hypothetical protein MTO96_019837 [Rhipicephalus appendiculatus]
MPSTWRRGFRLEEFSIAQKFSRAGRYRSVLLGRMTTEMCSTVPAASRHRRSNAESSTATAATVGYPEFTGVQEDSPPGGMATSSKILVTMSTAAPSSCSPRSDEVETMRCTREASWTPTAVQAAAPTSLRMGPAADSHYAPSAVVAGRSRVGGAVDGPFNSTMVKGDVPTYQMPPGHHVHERLRAFGTTWQRRRGSRLLAIPAIPVVSTAHAN